MQNSLQSTGYNQGKSLTQTSSWHGISPGSLCFESDKSDKVPSVIFSSKTSKNGIFSTFLWIVSFGTLALLSLLAFCGIRLCETPHWGKIPTYGYCMPYEKALLLQPEQMN